MKFSLPNVHVCSCVCREHAGVHRQMAYRVTYDRYGRPVVLEEQGTVAVMNSGEGRAEIVMADILYRQQQPTPAIQSDTISEPYSSDDEDGECCSSCCCDCCRRCCTRKCCWKTCKWTMIILLCLLLSVLFLAVLFVYMQASANQSERRRRPRR